MKSDYEVLGIAPGAAKEEIKRAYFRSVRLHSPEKDPEGFRKVRDAYERLSRIDTASDGPSFPEPATRMEEQFRNTLEKYIQNRNWEDAVAMAELALRSFPDSPYFLYRLAYSQREAGKTGKAVKTAEKLLEMDPKNRYYCREAGLACAARGFKKKGYPGLENALLSGCRDLELLYAYIGASLELGYIPHDDILLWTEESTKNTTDWRDNQNKDRIIHILLGLKRFRFYRDSEWQNQYLRLICNIAADPAASAATQSMEIVWVNLIDKTIEDWDYSPGMSLLVNRALSSIADRMSPGEDKDYAADTRHDVMMSIMDKDPRISDAFGYLLAVYFVKRDADDPDILEYAYLDSKLLALYELDQAKKDYEIIKAEYPTLAAALKPDVEPWLAMDEKQLEEEKARLLTSFADYVDRYSGGHFLEKHPELRQQVMKRHITFGDETFVREKKKIGRNDRCPCGSGKKFKQCCMGKGIYD